MQQERGGVGSAAEENVLYAIALPAVLVSAYAFFLEPFLPQYAKFFIAVAVFLAVFFINNFVLHGIASIYELALFFQRQETVFLKRSLKLLNFRPSIY